MFCTAAKLQNMNIAGGISGSALAMVTGNCCGKKITGTIYTVRGLPRYGMTLRTIHHVHTMTKKCIDNLTVRLSKN